MNAPGSHKSSNSGILGRLRHETRSEHEAVERDLPLLEPSFDREGFRIYLARAYGFHDALERGLAPLDLEAPELELGARAKTPLLAQDLHQLGYDTNALRRLPRCQALPPLTTQAHRLGCLYVIEGSTLGGQLLHRALVARWSDLAAAMSYFRGYGDATGARWQAFRDTLTGRCTSAADQAAAIASARETFRAFRAWLAPLNGAFHAVG